MQTAKVAAVNDIFLRIILSPFCFLLRTVCRGNGRHRIASVNSYAAEVPALHKKHERPKKLYEILAAFCEIPQDVLADLPVFTIRGRHEIEISGCTGILTYDSRCIVLAVGKETFCVRGDALLLSDFREKILYVRGNIDSASFGTGGNNDA